MMWHLVTYLGSTISMSLVHPAHFVFMPLLALTDERAAKLERQRDEKQAEMAELRNTSELQLWKRELDALRPRLQEYLEAEAE